MERGTPEEGGIVPRKDAQRVFPLIADERRGEAQHIFIAGRGAAGRVRQQLAVHRDLQMARVDR